MVKLDSSGIPVVDRMTSLTETDRPNVTGRSRYRVQEVVASDMYGNFSSQNFSPGGAGWFGGHLQTSRPPVGNPSLFTSPAWTAIGHAAGHQSKAAMDGLERGAGWFQSAAAAQSNLMAERARAMERVFSSPYVRVQQDVDIPLDQVVAESRKTAALAQEQLKGDVKVIEDFNRTIRESNDRLAGVLNGATNQGLPPERSAWTKWWVDQIGFAFAITASPTRPTVIEDVPLSYQPQLTPINLETRAISFQRMSCFGAGTPVRTIAGSRPIESLRVGDLVLTQSTETGALGYRPILVVHHNPPSPTFLIRVAGETIVSSPFHRFWMAGRGWVMAREIRAGDRLRTLDGVAEVASVESGPVQPVINLDVAEDADFFAGQAGALVHDNTLPDPRLDPFDAPRASKVVASAAPAR